MNRTLEEIANEYVTQSNLGTRHPIGFIVSETKQIPNAHGEGEMIIAYQDGDAWDFDNKEQMMEQVMDDEGLESYYKMDKKDLYEEDEEGRYYENEITQIEEIKENFEDMSMSELFEKYFPDAWCFTYDNERINKGKQLFLTKTGVEDHIKCNGHHLENPKSLLIYACWRNPEMELFMQSLYGHATVPREKWNYEAKRYYEDEVLNKVFNR